jgi:hypothetical protein
MSADLKDFRGKLTPLGYCWLEAEHRATGKDQSEIVRDLVHAWASSKSMAAIEAHKLMESEGIAGNLRERQGTSGKPGA